jgi:hypothetical protein
VFLPTAAELDAVVRESEVRRAVRDDLNHLGNLEAARGSVDAESFLAMVRRVQARDQLQAQVREADEARGTVQKWADALRRADLEVGGATQGFADEIRTAFREPKAFEAAFRQLSEEQKRHALHVLRERPADFAREFATGYGRDFGEAGELAAGRRGGVGAVSELERTGIVTAAAGERYLDAVRSRRITADHAARHLGLEPGASLKEVGASCAAQLAAASERKAAAIRDRDALGTVPTPKDLGRAFTGLHQQDRREVRRQVPGLDALMEDRGRQLSRSGPSL